MAVLRNEKGFTLLELIVSLVLIGIILLSFFSIMIQSNKTNRYSADTVDSTYIAQETMESVYGAIRKSGDIVAFAELPEIKDHYTTSCTQTPINCTLTSNKNPNIKIKLEQMPSSNNLIRVITSVSHDSNNDVVMESVWRWK